MMRKRINYVVLHYVLKFRKAWKFTTFLRAHPCRLSKMDTMALEVHRACQSGLISLGLLSRGGKVVL